jgi:hypothetical protein
MNCPTACHNRITRLNWLSLEAQAGWDGCQGDFSFVRRVTCFWHGTRRRWGIREHVLVVSAFITPLFFRWPLWNFETAGGVKQCCVLHWLNWLKRAQQDGCRASITHRGEIEGIDMEPNGGARRRVRQDAANRFVASRIEYAVDSKGQFSKWSRWRPFRSPPL